jgi:hypothetical protein
MRKKNQKKRDEKTFFGKRTSAAPWNDAATSAVGVSSATSSLACFERARTSLETVESFAAVAATASRAFPRAASAGPSSSDWSARGGGAAAREPRLAAALSFSSARLAASAAASAAARMASAADPKTSRSSLETSSFSFSFDAETSSETSLFSASASASFF